MSGRGDPGERFEALGRYTGTEQAQRAAAVRTVLRNAADTEDARHLLDVLGLIPEVDAMRKDVA